MSWTIPSISGTSQPEAVQADTIILHYEKGDREQPAGLYFDGRPDPKLGVFLRYEAKPNEPENLRKCCGRSRKAGSSFPRRLQSPCHGAA